MLLDPDLPGLLAIEFIRRLRGPRAIQTIKVGAISVLLSLVVVLNIASRIEGTYRILQNPSP